MAASSCVHVVVPTGVIEEELKEFMETKVGPLSGWSYNIKKRCLSSRDVGYALLQFTDQRLAGKACELSADNKLHLRGGNLTVTRTRYDIKQGPSYGMERWGSGTFHGGCLVSDTDFKLMWDPEVAAVTEFDFRAKLLRLVFKLKCEEDCECKLEFPFNQLHLTALALRKEQYKALFKLQHLPTSTEHFKAFLLKPDWAPQVFKRSCRELVPPPKESLLNSIHEFCDAKTFHNVGGPEEVWTRMGDLLPDYPIAQCRQFLVLVSNVSDEESKKVLEMLGDYAVVAPAGRQALETQVHLYYAFKQPFGPVLGSPHMNALPFELYFKLHSLVHFGTLAAPSLTPQFLAMIRPSYDSPVEWTMQALEEMGTEEGLVSNPMTYVRDALDKMSQEATSLKAPVEHRSRTHYGHHVWVRRMFVTPSRILLYGPELEPSNRVTRQFVKHIDCFLRVVFVEEDLSPLQYQALAKPIKSFDSNLLPESTAVHQRMKKIMDGFWIADKRFETLAFSTSQLREKSLWMFAAPNSEVTCETIRKFMGDFGMIRNVAKYAARMGQCFSASTPTYDVPTSQVERISDIFTTRNGITYNFSDGIGKISLVFAREVSRKCGFIKCDGRVPSAYHIRYGGYKGVVAQDPTVESNMTLFLRDSMCKFESTHTGFEVIKCSTAKPCHLNRQIITLLSTLGIPDETFEDMLKYVLGELDAMLHDPARALQFYSGDMLACLLNVGFDPSLDPHLMGVLRTMRASQLLDLRKKARIPVRKGRMMLGCLDEARTLQGGEVFIQISPLATDCGVMIDGTLSPVIVDGKVSTYIVTGDVIVTRSPCLHPGDIRRLNAVDNQRLRHMVDCVVFPQVGTRPHPSECSGGDLDGDEYHVIWDPRLIPSRMDEPMDYKPPPETKLDHIPTIQDIKTFHADSSLNPALGVITNAHVVMADKSPARARDKRCLQLAELCSIAVDFPKTGIPAYLPMDLKPKEYPDFMEKEHTEITYESTTILGKLWRQVKHSGRELLPEFLSPTKESVSRAFSPSFVVDGYQDYLEIAEIHKNWYDKKLIGLMNRYGVKNESEIYSGFILGVSPRYKKRGADEKERIAGVMKELSNEARKTFEDDKGNEEAANAKVSAYYYVTYHETYYEKNLSASGSNVHLLSFPWVFWERLVSITRSKGAAAGSHATSFQA